MPDAETIKKTHALVARKYAEAEEAAETLHNQIHLAMSTGRMSAVELADTLGVTRARIYQLRNKATP